MNKWILSLMVLVAGATLSFGETDYIANKRIDNILNGNTPLPAASLDAGSVGTSEIADGAVSAEDLNTDDPGVVSSPTSYVSGVLLQLGSIPTNAADSKTVTFGKVFAATPAVTVSAEAATTNIWYITAVNRTNFTVRSEAAVAGGYIAAGLAP